MIGLLTVEKLASQANCHPETVRRAIRDWQDGKPGLKAHRLGGKRHGPYRIDQMEAERWMGK